MDWAEACRILGVSETATDVEMREQYIYKAQLLHPDKNQDKPENIKRKAEAELALVNQAFRFLNNPDNNPYRIPPKLAIEPMGIHFKDVAIGQRKTTTLTIRNVGGPYTSIWIDNQPAPWLTVTGVKSLTNDRLPLEVALECVGTGEPGKVYSIGLSVKLENEKTHAVDSAIVKIELHTLSESAKPGVEKGMKTSLRNSGAEFPQDKGWQPVQKNVIGFSFGAFLLILLVFAALAIALIYFVNPLFKLDEDLFMIVVIAYIAIAFGISFNHGIAVGSARKNRNKKPRLTNSS
jgi:hypothetical protein